MIYLPAAGRTTERLKRAGQAAAIIAGFTIAAIAYIEINSAGRGAAAHLSLYASAILASVVAASFLSFAFARSLISQSTIATTAELARVVERLGSLDKKLDRQDETLRQVVKELARLRDMHRASDPTIGLDPESIEAARAIAKRLLDHPG